MTETAATRAADVDPMEAPLFELLEATESLYGALSDGAAILPAAR